MRAIGIFNTLAKVSDLCSAFVESSLCLPVSSAALVSAGMVIAKGLVLMSVAWIMMGALAALAMTAVLFFGKPSVSVDKHLAAKAKYENRRASIRSMADKVEHERSTNRYAGRYKIGTETKEKSE